MEIIRGKQPGAKKIVIYGPEGIGKSTFASQFPDPLFIDTEGSTRDMDVARTPAPSSWEMLLEQVEYVQAHPGICRTLVVDTIDWAEQLCVEHVCRSRNKSGIEDFGYGNGYIYAKEEFGRFLNKLSGVVDAGIHVVLTAHAQMRKFEQPDEMGSYDRWELKLGRKTTSQTSPLVKEWADMVLFANYKIYSIAVDDKGKKRKAQGGARVMYTSHHPCWDAKNRYGLPEEMPFDYAGITGIIGQEVKQAAEAQGGKPAGSGDPAGRAGAVPAQDAAPPAGMPAVPAEVPEPEPAAGPPEPRPDGGGGPARTDPATSGSLYQDSIPGHIPKALRDLMEANNVSEWDIQNVVQARGYYTSDVPIEKYDPDFISGCLVGAWPKMYAMIKEMKEKMEIPFN